MIRKFSAAVLVSAAIGCGPTVIEATNNRNDNENGAVDDQRCSRVLYDGAIGTMDTILTPMTASAHLRFSFRRYFDTNTRNDELVIDVNQIQCNRYSCQSREIVRGIELFAPVQLQLYDQGQRIYVNLEWASYRSARVNIAVGEDFFSTQTCPNFVPSYRECEVTNPIAAADISGGRVALIEGRLRLRINQESDARLLVQDITFQTEPYSRRFVSGQTLTLRTLDDHYYGITINENSEMTVYACR
jgi:hypothetical protein